MSKQQNFCRICENREPGANGKVLCSLTGKEYDMGGKCPEFIESEVLKESELKKELIRASRNEVHADGDYQKHIENGILFILIGILLTVVSKIVLKDFGYYMIFTGLIFYGVVCIVRGVRQKEVVLKYNAMERELKKRRSRESNREGSK